MSPQRAGRDTTKLMLRHRQMVLDQTDFKQKAKEKKMSMSKNIARLAVTAGLTAALSFGGVMAPVTMAFAEGDNTITITQNATNGNTRFKAYQIFKADVVDKDGKKVVSNVEWASPEAKTAVLGVLTAENAPGITNASTPQGVADYLSETLTGTSTSTVVKKDDLLNKIALAVEKSVLADGNAFAAGTPFTATHKGYFLFMTDADSLKASEKQTGTSPIFAVVGGEAVTVTEKTSIPTVDKKVLAATSADPTQLTTGWAGVANSQIGQEVTYKLTGKVADNYATYDSYAYKFTDTLSNGLDYVGGSLKVYAVNNGVYTLINSGYDLTTPTEDNRVLTVNFAVDKATGKKGLKDIDSVNADTEIVVFYKAKLNKNAVTGNGTEGKKGNYNAVKLEYSNNPYTEGTGTSVEGGAGDFTFKLNLNKVDQGTEKGLGGAVFTIQSDDANTMGQYVASEDCEAENVVAGQLVTVEGTDLPEYVKFTSDAEGKIAASGLDAGSYKVTEVQTPGDSYTAAQPFTFTITPTYDSNGTKIESLKAEFEQTRSDIAFGELNNTPGDNELTGKDDTGTNPTTGEVTINVGNTKSVGLPLTGLNGVTLTWIAGGAVLCIGVAHLIRSRKQAEESEQE